MNQASQSRSRKVSQNTTLPLKSTMRSVSAVNPAVQHARVMQLSATSRSTRAKAEMFHVRQHLTLRPNSPLTKKNVPHAESVLPYVRHSPSSAKHSLQRRLRSLVTLSGMQHSVTHVKSVQTHVRMTQSLLSVSLKKTPSSQALFPSTKTTVSPVPGVPRSVRRKQLPSRSSSKETSPSTHPNALEDVPLVQKSARVTQSTSRPRFRQLNLETTALRITSQ